MAINLANSGVSTEFKIEGLKELQATMLKLGPEIQKKAIWSALLSGAQVVKKEAERMAPVLTGRLEKAILVKNVKGIGYIIGVRHGRKEQKKDRDAYYWTFQEFGTDGKKGIIRAKHFIENALKNKIPESFRRVKDKLTENIQKLVSTL